MITIFGNRILDFVFVVLHFLFESSSLKNYSGMFTVWLTYLFTFFIRILYSCKRIYSQLSYYTTLLII